MATIAITWELGSDRGHISRLCTLARALYNQQHKVILIVSDHSLVESLLSNQDQTRIKVIRLPNDSPLPATYSRDPCNFSEVLLTSGYYDTKYLTLQFSLWNNLYKKIKPDLVVFDYSPAALFVARSWGFKKIVIGAGFTVPPLVSPYPSYHPSQNISGDNLAQSDLRLLKTINTALESVNLTALDSLNSSYENAQTFVLSNPIIDPYAEHRTNEVYLGSVRTEPATGKEICWQSSIGTPKIIGYLKPHFENLKLLLNALVDLNAEANIFVPGIPPDIGKMVNGTKIKISDTPYRLKEAFVDADYFLCHGGNSYTLECLQKGIPGILIPLQMEQSLTALRIAQLKLGAAINPYDKNLYSHIGQLLSTQKYKTNANGLKNKKLTIKIEDLCNEIINHLDSG
ncbi:glycosyltransferase [Teredinibacter turnerae]|uniref:glycosyltransferase n=1 Tax=Teredinibacter turnerae TaxID=2426 RepID=UPI0005F842B9|nr:glycosyltransferase [Teredinibacter turnerae]